MQLLAVLLVFVSLLPSAYTSISTIAEIDEVLLNISFHALMTKPRETAIVSPFSIALALATVNLGAKEKTSQEITDVVFRGLSMGEVISWFQDKLHQLKGESSPWSVASALYHEKTMNVITKYYDGVKEDLKSDVEHVDFKSTPQAQRTLINSLVNSTTVGCIPELLEEDHVTAETKLIAMNALYLKTKISTGNTSERLFNSNSGSTIPDKTTNDITNGRFFENDDYVYGDFPFDEEHQPFRFYIIVPKSRSLSTITDQLLIDVIRNSSALNFGEHYAVPSPLRFTIPKLSQITSEFDVSEILRSMGVVALFDANLKGISDVQLFAERFVHKATIELNENGVTASTATGASFGSSPHILPEQREFHGNRPFLFGIVHGLIPMFLGHYY